MERRLREAGELGWRPPSRLRRGLALCFGLALLLAAGLTFFRPGRNDLDARVPPAPQRDAETGRLALVSGLILFSTLTALIHIAARRRWARRENERKAEIVALRRRLDRAELGSAVESQAVIAWRGSDCEPDIDGDLSLLRGSSASGSPATFDAWLAPEMARQLGGVVDRLRAKGEPFRCPVTNLDGRHLDVEGRPVDGRAVVRIKDVGAERLEATRLRELQARTTAELRSLWAMLDAVPNPAWIRDGEGRLARVNAAYARAVEAKDPTDAVARGVELLERQARDRSAQARAAGSIWRGRAPAIVVGERRIFDVVDAATDAGSVGLAQDISEIEFARDALARETQAHARTLDQLSTAVVIFDRLKRLVFHNAAYRQLWGLDQAWLEQRRTDSEILDRLRAARLLPEQADFRAWQAALFSAYQSLETEEQAWYLPDGRTLRVVVNPNPQGGVTYLFDDVTERFHLQSQFNAAIRVQSETLDTLKEGVAVFGSDGRLKLFNPAFAGLWALRPGQLDDQPHIDRVAQLCGPLFAASSDWDELRAAVAGLPDHRLGFESRLARRDGTVLDCAAAPLPDGATLLTFIDATAGVSVERALTERNQALIDAERLRNDFVHHVSYELRSPLTNIIGFIQLLGDPAVGPLNDRQLEYAGYVTKSSSALLAIINDILDLASIDADAMELSLDEVDIAETMRAAAEGVQDRLAESNLSLRVIAVDGIGAFVADGKRIRQILFNLLSNAIGFSAPGQTIDLAALRRGGEIVFKVSDQGRGVPADVIDHIFDRFKTHTAGSRHRGVGLGLSIVRSFVELHGGRILIQSAPMEGTTVTCIFPAGDVKLESGDSERERKRNGG
jgi:signal transduction histidine kinase